MTRVETGARVLSGAGERLATWRRGPRRRILAAVVLVTLVVSLTVIALVTRQSRDSGPLGFDYEGNVSLATQYIKRGEPLTYGLIVRNRGDQPVVLRRVEFVGDTQGASIGPALTAGVNRTWGSIATDQGFPPHGPDPGTLESLAGSVVPAHSDVGPDGSPGVGVNILIRLAFTDGDIHRFTGIRVHYLYEGDTRVYTDPTRLMFCPGTCPDR